MKSKLIYFVIGIFIFVLVFYQKAKMNFNQDTALFVYQKWNFYAKKYSAYFKIPTDLILSIICVESQGNENILGVTKDYGLMQITQPALTDFNTYYKKDYTIEQMVIGYYNIEVGTGYLAILKNRFKNNPNDYYKFYNSKDLLYQMKVNAYLDFYKSKNII